MGTRHSARHLEGGRRSDSDRKHAWETPGAAEFKHHQKQVVTFSKTRLDEAKKDNQGCSKYDPVVLFLSSEPILSSRQMQNVYNKKGRLLCRSKGIPKERKVEQSSAAGKTRTGTHIPPIPIPRWPQVKAKMQRNLFSSEGILMDHPPTMEQEKFKM